MIRYAIATTGVTAMPTASPCMKPKKVSTAPASANAEALTNFLSMTKAPIAASTSPVKIEPPPMTLRPA